MDTQTIINLLFAAFGALAGSVLRTIWVGVTELQRADRDLTTKIGEIEVLVAGEYMKRDEFERLSDAIFKKLDRIENKLDHKADKV